MNITEFQIKLKSLGFDYGEDAAENALMGYNLALKELQQSLLTFSPPLDTMRSEAEGITELKAGRH